MDEEYDQLFGNTSTATEPAPAKGNNQYAPPAAQTELGKQFDQYFVKAWNGDDRQCLDYRDIDRACDKASYMHFREGYNTRVIAVNLAQGTAAELRWQGKDVGYQVHRAS
jgi:hypothetical protein